MPQIMRMRTMLEVASIASTIEFYGRLGFRLLSTYGPPDKPTWCEVGRDGVTLMFSWSEPHTHDDGTEHSHAPALSGSIYLNVDDVDALFDEFRSAGVSFEWEPESMEHGMREFAVCDPDGYLLVFASPTS